jgi:hypothetical protein
LLNLSSGPGRPLIQADEIVFSNVSLTMTTSEAPVIETKSVKGDFSLTALCTNRSSSRLAAFVPPFGDFLQISNLSFPFASQWDLSLVSSDYQVNVSIDSAEVEGRAWAFWIPQSANIHIFASAENASGHLVDAAGGAEWFSNQWRAFPHPFAEFAEQAPPPWRSHSDSFPASVSFEQSEGFSSSRTFTASSSLQTSRQFSASRQFLSNPFKPTPMPTQSGTDLFTEPLFFERGFRFLAIHGLLFLTYGD